MDLRWLRVLVELADYGTLRAVADVTGYSTSAVSQHLAALQRSLDTVLVEPAGRRLVFTPAGRALLPHARAILAALDTARGELAPSALPTGLVRVAGYATSLAHHVIPAIATLRDRYPGLGVTLQEREPTEVQSLLDRDEIDVGVIYDLSLVPRGVPAPAYHQVPIDLVAATTDDRSAEKILTDPTTEWITNSRASDDDELIHRLAARFDLSPRITYRIDSLDLIVQLVAAGLGTSLVAADGPRHPGVRYLRLHGAGGTRRSYALTRPGRQTWPANAAVLDAITTAAVRTRRDEPDST